jgi:subtilisin family serine protease
MRPARTRLWLELLEDRTVPSGLPPGYVDFNALRLDTNAYDPTRIVVKLRDGVEAASLSVLPGTQVGDEIAPDLVPDLRTIHITGSATVAEVVQAYSSNPLVEYATPNYMVSIALTPNDPQFNNPGPPGGGGLLYGMHNTGQFGGVVDADIDAPEAWDIGTGSYGTAANPNVIAVIDTGIDYRHQDLYLNIWINQGEIPASRKANLTDTDSDGQITFLDLNNPINQGPGKITDINGNGRIDGGDLLATMTGDTGGWADGLNNDNDTGPFPDDLVGARFVNNAPFNKDPMDDHFHGTHVSGTIAGIGNNGVGVVGVNWRIQLMAVKFLGAGGGGTFEDSVRAVNYAVSKGARISSNSWGGGLDFQPLKDAIAASANAGHLFIAAAGNHGSSAPMWPAAFPLDNIISVAATDRNDNRAGFSAFGLGNPGVTGPVHLGAPGVDTQSTFPNNGYSAISGTSMATPHVSGVAGLVRSLAPNMTYQQIKKAILDGVDPNFSLRNPGPTPVLTGGRLNARKTLGLLAAGPVVVAQNLDADSAAPVSSLRVTFDRAINVPTFTIDDIVSFTGPGGAAIPVTGVSVVAGTGNTQFDITFPTQSALGAYSMVMGPDIRDTSGNQMDQNTNRTPGEVPGDRYTANFKLAGPRITASSPGGVQQNPVSAVRVTFTQSIDPATFTPADVTFTRGVTPIPVNAVSPVAGTNNKQFDISFAPQGAVGAYTMVIGPDVRNGAGTPMDQNQNGVPGENPGDRFTHTFSFVGPRITASSPAGGNFASLDRVRVTFSKPMDPATFQTTDVVVTGPQGNVLIGDVQPVGGTNNTQFDVFFGPAVFTGFHTMVIGPDIRDTSGNQMDQNQNGTPGEVPADRFTLNFGILGPRVNSHSPTGTIQGPAVSFIQVIFNRTMDPGNFTVDDIVTFTRTNGAVVTPLTATGVVPVAGTNNTRFNITFDPQTATGMYRLVFGPNVYDVWANAMDQNNNLIPGEAGDTYTATFNLAGLRVNSATPVGNVTGPVNVVRVNFSRAINQETFTPDDIVSFTGPGGPVNVLYLNPVSPTQIEIYTDDQVLAGQYTMVLGPDIEDLNGNRMDQNNNFNPGEVPGDRFTHTFRIVGAFVTAASPTGPTTGPVESMFVQFNVPMDPSTFTLADIVSFTGPGGAIPVTDVAVVPDSGDSLYLLTFPAQEAKGTYTLVLGPDIVDTLGQRMDQNRNGIVGEVPGDRFTNIFRITAGVVGYFTDFNTFSQGPAAPINQAGFGALQVTNISTLDLSTVNMLFVDESNNGGLSSPMFNRLADIRNWVEGGGVFIVHDRWVANSETPQFNPFFIGAPNTRAVRRFDFGPDLDVIPPGNTLVTNGPHGVINNSTLDNGNFSNHGWVQGPTLPPGSKKILSAGPSADNVAAFSYPLGSGFVYYSSIPLDFYLDQGGPGQPALNFRTIYTPNVLAYMDNLKSGGGGFGGGGFDGGMFIEPGIPAEGGGSDLLVSLSVPSQDASFVAATGSRPSSDLGILLTEWRGLPEDLPMRPEQAARAPVVMAPLLDIEAVDAVFTMDQESSLESSFSDSPWWATAGDELEDPLAEPLSALPAY